MSDLNERIDQWCRDVLLTRCGQAERMDELRDHMHSLVDQFTSEGMDEQQAFDQAVAQMGDADELERAFAEDLPALARMQRFDQRLVKRLTGHMSGRQVTAWLLGISLAYAGILLSMSLFWPDWAWRSIVTNVLLILWALPMVILSASRQAQDAERGLFRRLFRRESGPGA